MKSLKQIINRYIRSAAIVMALVILVVIAFAEILIEQGRVEDTAAGTFVRLEQIIEENENELKQVKEKYDKTCLHDAEAIAFLLQKDPEATNDTLKLKKYANLLELDEIHIFDETGTIVSGTNPEYYGYSFSSGEQMAFFAPMLTDKSLQLVQDAGPNTARRAAELRRSVREACPIACPRKRPDCGACGAGISDLDRRAFSFSGHQDH